MKRKKDFEKAKAEAEKITNVSGVTKTQSFNTSKMKTFAQTEATNLLLITIAHGLREIGWYSAMVDGIKTLYVSK